MILKVLIGSAWPYANGSLHIGHIAALLPGDVIARYHRAIGNEVYYVSGSDCHGTPVTIRARQENKSPKEISDFYHNEFVQVFKRLGFSYEMYGKTSSKEHIEFVRDFHKKMYENKELIYEKTAPQAYCPHCETLLTDRFVEGTCPTCGELARGDQCDACGTILEPETLLNPHCALCGEMPVFQESRHIYIAVSKLEKQLREYLCAHPEWRKNAIAFTTRYIDEGLRDRAITRTLDWGIGVPKDGYENKKIYIWAENVLGYLSMSKAVSDREGKDFDALWHGNDALHYYIHGKDNIPFHTIILPALMIAHSRGWRLPDTIVSSEYMTLEGLKISTSQNWAIWGRDIVEHYNPDSLRYYFIKNGPEKRDSDFSWREYVNNHNGELLGAYGNFVNRTLVFIQKYFDGIIPCGGLVTDIEFRISEILTAVGEKLYKGQCKDASREIFSFVREANNYFDESAPWKTRTDDPEACRNTLFNCVQIIANLSVLLYPFLPFSSEKIQKWLNLCSSWKTQYVPAGYVLPEIDILFARLDKEIIYDELKKLRK